MDNLSAALAVALRTGGTGLAPRRGCDVNPRVEMQVVQGINAGVDSDGLVSRMLLSVPEVCRALGVGRDTVYALIASGELRSVKIASLRKVRRVDLDAYVASLAHVGVGTGA